MNVCALMDPKSVTPGRSNVIFIAFPPSFCKGSVSDGALWQWCTLVGGHTTNLPASLGERRFQEIGLLPML